MAAGRFGEWIGIREEAIKKACGLAMRAHRSPPYLLEKHRGGEILFGFAGAWSVNEWFSRNPEKPFNETEIDLQVFPSMKSIGKEETAMVNEAFLRSFERVLASSTLVYEVQKAVTEGNQILFTGHSSGGSMAVLATLWCLEKCIKPSNIQILPRCVSFGSPLLGNQIFSHALKRENWSDRFIHFVMRFDIVPRILLAPLSSIEQELQPVLNSLNPNSLTFGHEINDYSVFYLTVMRNASTVSSHAACKLMGSTSFLPEILTSFIDLSPYRPFGTHIFCSGNGKLIIVRNLDAILQMLFYCCQLASEAEGVAVALKSLQDHLQYERELWESLQMQNVVHLDHLKELPYADDEAGGGVVHMALNDLGLSTRARQCLRAAGELQQRKEKNERKIDGTKSRICYLLNQVEGYQVRCEVHGMGYYDSFSLQKDQEDFQINVKRLELAGLFDTIIEMLKRGQLPDEFENRKEWVDLGTKYRRFVEPLDIANYYRNAMNDDTGPYMKSGRPRRYRTTQGWFENARKVPAETCWESCFWAEVEELCVKTGYKRSLEDGQERVLMVNAGVQERLSRLEAHVLKWYEGGELGREVLLEGSTFVKWWEKLPLAHQSKSCIAMLMRG